MEIYKRSCRKERDFSQLRIIRSERLDPQKRLKTQLPPLPSHSPNLPTLSPPHKLRLGDRPITLPHLHPMNNLPIMIHLEPPTWLCLAMVTPPRSFLICESPQFFPEVQDVFRQSN